MSDPNKDEKQQRKEDAAQERADDKAAREEARAKRKAEREAAGLPPEPDEEQPVVDNTLPEPEQPPTATQQPA